MIAAEALGRLSAKTASDTANDRPKQAPVAES